MQRRLGAGGLAVIQQGLQTGTAGALELPKICRAMAPVWQINAGGGDPGRDLGDAAGDMRVAQDAAQHAKSIDAVPERHNRCHKGRARHGKLGRRPQYRRA
jgi:hypothetical protein